MDLKKGIFYILLASFCFTWMSTFTKLISPAVPLPLILFFQSVIGLAVISPLMYRDHDSLKTSRIGLIAVRALSGLLGITFLFLAVRYISITNAVLLNNMAPLVVPFILRVWLKVPINHKLWPGIITGFAGVIFILKPDTQIFNPGICYGLLSAITLAITLITTRQLSQTEKSHTIVFYYLCIAGVLTAPFMIMEWKTPTFIQGLGVLGVCLATIAGILALNRAFIFGKTSQLSPFVYMGVVFAAFIQWMIYHDFPDWVSWIGICLVAGGGMWTTLHSQQR